METTFDAAYSVSPGAGRDGAEASLFGGLQGEDRAAGPGDFVAALKSETAGANPSAAPKDALAGSAVHSRKKLENKTYDDAAEELNQVLSHSPLAANFAAQPSRVEPDAGKGQGIVGTGSSQGAHNAQSYSIAQRAPASTLVESDITAGHGAAKKSQTDENPTELGAATKSISAKEFANRAGGEGERSGPDGVQSTNATRKNDDNIAQIAHQHQGKNGAQPDDGAASKGVEHSLPLERPGHMQQSGLGAISAPREATGANQAAHLVAAQQSAHHVAISAIARLDDKILEVRLDPPDLGKISIEFSDLDSRGIRAMVSADLPGTLDFLRRHSDQLALELARHGFSGADLQFSDQPARDGSSSEKRRSAARTFQIDAAPAPESTETLPKAVISNAYDRTV